MQCPSIENAALSFYQRATLSPETNMAQDTSDHPTTAVRAVNKNIYTNKVVSGTQKANESIIK